MDIILFLISFACIIALIIGMIKPSLVIRWGNCSKVSRASVLKYYGAGFFIAFILFIIVIPKEDISETTSNEIENEIKVEAPVIEKTAEEKAEEEKIANEKAETKKAEEAEKVAQAEKSRLEKEAQDKIIADAKAEAEKIAYDTGITYEQLARTPDSFISKKVKFVGKVIQVIEGDKETQLRLAVNGDYDTVILLVYKKEIVTQRVLDGDQITIKGVSGGLITYQSALGGNISIPGILVDEVMF